MGNSQDCIEIAGEVIEAGKSKDISLPMPKLYDGSPLHLTAHVVNGKNPGPVLCIMAAVHGDELNGIEIVRRVIKSKKLKKLNGALIAIPVVNVYGMLYQQRYLMDRRDLNRSFPGSAKGSLAARLANLITETFINKSTHIIDLHTGSLHRSNLPQIRVNLDDPILSELAKSFGPPVILHSKLRDGSLRSLANDLAIPYLLYESGEALRLDETAIKIGMNGILGVMCKLGMLDVSRKKIMMSPAVSDESVWIRARRNGLFQVKSGLGKRVKKEDVIAWISDPMGVDDYKVVSPIEGIIIGINNIPLVHEGAAIFHIATFEKLSKEQISLLDLLEDEDVESMMFTDE